MLAVLFEMFCNGPDRPLLIGALDDLSIDRLGAERLTACSPLDQKLKLIALIEATDLAGRIARVVPNPVLVAIGIEDHRPLAKAPLEKVGIELGLLLAAASILARALRLHEPQRLAIGSP